MSDSGMFSGLSHNGEKALLIVAVASHCNFPGGVNPPAR